MRVLTTLLLGAALLTACATGAPGEPASRASDPEDTVSDDAAEGTGGLDEGTGAAARGTLRLAIQELDGVFVEGFQLTLVIEDGDGERTYAWDQLVTGNALEWPAGVGERDIERWYTGTLVEDVAAGPITVISKLDVGMEPPGDPCRLDLEVPAGGSSEVRIRLTDPRRGCPILP